MMMMMMMMMRQRKHKRKNKSENKQTKKWHNLTKLVVVVLCLFVTRDVFAVPIGVLWRRWREWVMCSTHEVQGKTAHPPRTTNRKKAHTKQPRQNERPARHARTAGAVARVCAVLLLRDGAAAHHGGQERGRALHGAHRHKPCGRKGNADRAVQPGARGPGLHHHHPHLRHHRRHGHLSAHSLSSTTITARNTETDKQEKHRESTKTCCSS